MPVPHSGDVKIATHPIATAGFASLCSAMIAPPKHRLIEPRPVIDQLPLWIVPQLPNDPRILLGRIAGEHGLERFAQVGHGRASPDQIPRAIHHHPLSVRRNLQRVVRNELEAATVTLADGRINPRVEIAIDRDDVIRPGVVLEIVAGPPATDPDPSRGSWLGGRLFRIDPRGKAIAISALERFVAEVKRQRDQKRTRIAQMRGDRRDAARHHGRNHKRDEPRQPAEEADRTELQRHDQNTSKERRDAEDRTLAVVQTKLVKTIRDRADQNREERPEPGKEELVAWPEPEFTTPRHPDREGLARKGL